ncbi:MAG: phosphatase PAP2 family protein [Ruminococcus sp.]|nr:phosphatase PAP2 family protein [Ruminococcus sp.]
MTEKSYKKIEVFFKAHDKLYFLLRIIYKYLPLFIYLLYPVLLVNTFIHMVVNGEKDDFIKTLVIPAVTFLSVTLLRKIINRPRPYEALDINPLIEKNTVGQSFPSRHSASIFTIAIASYTISPALMAVLLVIGVIMSVSRVLAGVHYISDVVAGALYAIALSLIGLFI